MQMLLLESHWHLILQLWYCKQVIWSFVAFPETVRKLYVQKALHGNIFMKRVMASYSAVQCWFFNLIDWVLTGANIVRQISLELNPRAVSTQIIFALHHSKGPISSRYIAFFAKSFGCAVVSINNAVSGELAVIWMAASAGWCRRRGGETGFNASQHKIMPEFPQASGCIIY